MKHHLFTLSVIKALSPLRNPEEAVAMSNYMKGKFPFLGIKAPDRRFATSELLSKKNLFPISDLGVVIRELWSLEEREFQMVALDILGKHKKRLTSSHIDLLEHCILNKSWWDTVDFIASTCIGTLVQSYPGETRNAIEGWIKSENLWLNRTTIIHQLKLKERTDTDLLIRSIKPHISSSEFFHQKAIGWALREYSKYNPGFVIHFVNSNTLKPLSKREALRLM